MSGSARGKFLELIGRIRKLAGKIEFVMDHDFRSPAQAAADVVEKATNTDHSWLEKAVGNAVDDIAAKQKYAEELAPRVFDVIALSPTLTRHLRELRGQGWRIKYDGPEFGGDEYFDRKVLNIPTPEKTMFRADVAWTTNAFAEEVAWRALSRRLESSRRRSQVPSCPTGRNIK
ncbi:hypothetical protein [Nocardia sp. NPDC049149]|uniref:hypothetical protein n=1 Tax=Nocardia sp. NPDC049149 TaxID=3364315 RepID=UPI0037134D02